MLGRTESTVAFLHFRPKLLKAMTQNPRSTPQSSGKTPAAPLERPQVIAETPQWWVISKPAGWLSVPPSEPGAGGGAPVLVQWVREQLGPAFAVHRLDRETSGVLLFARTEAAHREASLWFQEHQVKKTYLCCAVGEPQTPMMRLAEPIRGASAVTQVEIVAKRLGHFLAKVRPMTGKRHQIRIHLSKAGHALWGDREYSGPAVVDLGGLRLSIPRVALHASELELPNGEKFVAPEPEDFSLWSAVLRSSGEGTGSIA